MMEIITGGRRRVTISNVMVPTIPESETVELNLHRTGITIIPYWLFDLRSLEELSIVDAPLTEIIGGSIFPRRLEMIKISRTRLREFPKNFPDHVRSLDLSFNQIDDPHGFADLPGTLRELNLQDNRITLLPKMFPLRILTKLTLDTNELTTLPRSLPNTLVFLSVNGNYLTELPSFLPRGLRVLHAANNSITELSLKNMMKKRRRRLN